MKRTNNHTGARHSHSLQLRPLALALYCVSLISLPGIAGAQVVVASGNTKVYTAPNGVPVVDIATANAAGLSHNVFSDFNVARNGLVLNNGDTSQLTRQSQLAGQTSANMNLNSAAKVILNEVTSTNRSTLAGYMEVLGAKADVVIANPYGITCSGCGFINTPRVTLTTGVPTIDGGGNLTGVRVGRGDILVSGSGLNGAGVDYLDLVARSVRIDGQVNGSDLAVVAGNNSWDYATRSATATGPAGDAPVFGIDASALGGMYANRIRLMATEQGVGVRLLGDAAASAAELTLSAGGQITLQGRLSAQAGSVAVTGTGAGGAIAVNGRGASISAAHDVALATDGAGISLTDAALNAGGDLQVRSGGVLADAASAGNPSATRFAGGTLTFAAAGAATIDGTTWGAGAGLGMRANTLAVGAGGATIYSGSNTAAARRDISVATSAGDLNLGGAHLVAPGAIALDAGGALLLGAGGRLEAAGGMALTAAGRFDSAGTALAATAMAVRAASVNNRGLLQAGAGLTVDAGADVVNADGAVMLAGAALNLRGATLSNNGVIQAAGPLDAQLDMSMTNGGKLLSTTDIAVRSGSASFTVDNRNLIQAGGSLAIGADGHVANLGNGAAATLAGGSAALTLGTLSNQGTIQGDRGVAIAAGGDATNATGGVILTHGQGAALVLGTGGQLRNDGTLQADGAVTLTAATALANSGSVAGQAEAVSVAAGGDLSNSGSVASQAGAVSLAAGGAFANSGTVAAQSGAIDLRGASIDNSGIIGASGKLDLASGSVLTNSGTIQSAGPLSARVATSLANAVTGKLLSTGDVTIASGSTSFAIDNRNRIQAGGALTLGAAAGRADLHNFSGATLLGNTAGLTLGALANDGTLQSSGTLAIDAGGAVANNSGAVIVTTGGGAVGLRAGAALTNAGRLESSGALTLATTAALENGGSIVTLSAADGALMLQADALHNAGSIAAAGTATIAARSLANDGTAQSQGALVATLGESLNNSGVLLSAGAVGIGSGAGVFSVTNSGRIQAAGDASIGSAGHLADFSNTDSGLLLGAGTVFATRSFANDGIIQARQAMRVDAAGPLANGASGQMLTLGGTLALAAGGDLTNLGAIQSSQDMSLAASGTLSNSGGMQTLGGALAAQGARVVNTGNGFVRSADALALGAGASLDNSGKLIAAGQLQVDSSAASFTLTNAGRMQAGAALTLGSAGHVAALTNQAGAVLLGNEGQMNLASLSNAGIIQGVAGLDIDVRGDADNLAGASVLTQDASAAALLFRVGGTLRNTGQLQSAGDMAVVTGGDMVNLGTAASGATASVNVGGTLDNRKLIQGMSGADIAVGTSLANTSAGSILSGGALTVSGTRGAFDLTNDGRIQSATDLNAGSASANVNLVNNTSGIIVGGNVVLTAVALGNAGLIQGTSLHVAAANALSNGSGARLLADGGSSVGLSLSGATLANDGTVQSTGSMNLAANTVTNSGKLYTVPALAGGAANGTLSVTAQGNFTNSGTVSSNGDIGIIAGDLANPGAIGSRGAASVTVDTSLVNGGTFASAGDLSVQSPRAYFNLTNSGSIDSAGRLLVGTSFDRVALVNSGSIIGGSVEMAGSTMDNVGSSSKVLSAAGGGGRVQLGFESTMNNGGVLHADGQMDLTASAITNATDGGISAIGDLNMTAVGGDLVNNGWMFALADMRLTASGHAIRNSASGNIEATTAPKGNITVDSGNTGSFTNANYINAAGTLDIHTGSFVNQSGDTLPTLAFQAPVLQGGKVQVGASGGFNCNLVLHNDCAYSTLYRFDYISDQAYSFSPDSVRRAQLLSTGDITISYGSAGSNTFSLISGRDVTITARSGASAFVNADLHKDRQLLSRYVWIRENHDETRYPTSEAAYDAVTGHTSDNEAPGSWASYGNASASAEEVATASNIYSKVTATQSVPSQPNYSAGIYASRTFSVQGSLNMVGGAPSLGAAPAAPTASGTVAMPVAVANVAAGAAIGINAPNGGSATRDGLLPVSARGGSTAAMAAFNPTSTGAPAGLTAVVTGGAAAGSTTAVGAKGVAFTGPNLALPTSPNGLYVVAAPNNTQYLVETNPLFGAGGAVGSNYLAQRLGFDPATVEKRLGDANYEARLVRDQLVAQTNNFLLGGYSREADQMKGLMDNAVRQTSALGLTFGKALTAEQAGRLTDDLVWMVEASVNGQKVLAPVVYLSAKTRDSVLNGSVIAARDVRIDGDTVSNNGGTIAATNTLDITTRGDITNTGGAIRANTVALTSTEGNVVNQTSATFYGNDTYGRTSIGATGTIAATGDLKINAAKDVRVIGASVTAGGDAAIQAGNNVVFDTIENKRADTSGGASGNGANGSSWSRNEIDTRQVGSTVTTGGNLAIKSGNDVTIAGSTVKVGGNLDANAGRDLNVIDRQDVNQLTESTKSHSSGFTASGSSVGYAVTDESQTTKTRTGTSVGTSIVAGGNANLAAKGTATVRGSDVSAVGDLAVSATDVKVLAGQNTFDQTIDKKISTTGVSVGVDIKAVTGIVDLARGGTPSAADVARVAADAYGNQGVSVGVNSSTTTSHSQESNSNARVSSLTSGGKTTVTANNAATFEGTQVTAGGDINVKAKDINMVEARNTTSYTSQSETTGMNISVSTDPTAIARKAVADNVYSGGGDGVTLATVSNTRRDTTGTTDKGVLGSFTSGGSMTRSATGTITDQGTQITVAKDFTQTAGTINSLAATDKSTNQESETTNSGRIGVSVDFAATKAFNDAKKGDPGTALGMLGGPTIGVDANYTRDVKSTSEQTTTARVGNIVAGGNIVSESTGVTKTQGTNLLSGGNTSISASRLQSEAARNTQTSSTDGNTIAVDVRVQVDVMGKPGGSLAAGYSASKSSDSASQAVTGTIGAGGNVTIKTTGDAVFEGTQLAAGKNVSIDAGGAVDMKSANSTTSASASQWGVKGEVSVSGSGKGASKGASVAVNVGSSSSASSTAQAGGIRAGDNVSIVAHKDVTLEGTTVGAGKDASISTTGNINLLAAKSSSSSDRSEVDAKVGGSRSAKSQSVSAKVGVDQGKERSTTEVGSDIAVGNKLTLNSGGKTLMQGTQVDAGTSATIAAAGGVTRQDAANTSSSDSLKVVAYAQVAGKRDGGKPAATGQTRPRSNAVADEAPTRARSNAVTEQETRPRSNAVTEAPSKPSTWSKVKDAGSSAKNTVSGGVGKVAEVKKTKSGGLVYASKSDTSDSSSTAVAIREGSAAKAAQTPLPQMAGLMALPAVKSAAQVNAALAGALAQYGSQAAIPADVKRGILLNAGLTVPAGASVDALLKQTQSAGKTAAVAGLASANLNAEQQAAALKSMGLGQ